MFSNVGKYSMGAPGAVFDRKALAIRAPKEDLSRNRYKKSHKTEDVEGWKKGKKR